MRDPYEVLDSMLVCRGYKKDPSTLMYVKDNKSLPIYHDINQDPLDVLQFIKDCTDPDFILLILSIPMTKKNIDKFNSNLDLKYYDK
ncbi:hypothetical protein K7432_018543, partial [Basidiobolus ranarum]